MGKGHKERRREKRAQEIQEREKDARILKEELEKEIEKKNEEYQLIKKQNEEKKLNEKSIEISSDTDSGRGSSILTITDSPKSTKINENDESVITKSRQSSIKGLYNIGNTCFFNVIIQSLVHTPPLLDSLYQSISNINDNSKKYSSTTTAQLIKLFDQFTSNDRKQSSIDPKPLFNTIIQQIPSYKDYDQRDCHELFMNLMLILRAEEIQLRQLQPRSTANSTDDNDSSKMFCLIGCNEPYTTYDSVFGGHLLDIMTCKKCKKSLMRIEPFLGLLLPLTDRMSSAENYRNRRRRDEYALNKSKKEQKTLSRKQLKALKKQEKKNSRRSANTTSNKIRGRQAANKKNIEETLSNEESSNLLSIDNLNLKNEEDKIQSLDESVSATKEDDNVKPEQEPVEDTEKQDESESENNNEDPEDEDDDQEQSKGPLTTVESTCTLADMVSKLTLIHENTSRPLPFVDETIGQKLLTSQKTNNDMTLNDDTDDIRTLEHCFQRYFKPETLEGENLFDCYYCRSMDPTQKRTFTEAIRQTVLIQLPPVLPIFLKRFQTYGSHSEKINKFVEFPLQLDLTNRCSSQVKQNSAVYSLYAAIEHSGTLRSGHYIVYIKQSAQDNDFKSKYYSKPIDYLIRSLFENEINEPDYTNTIKTEPIDPSLPPPSWYHISDNAIHKVPENKVLAANAYVLFYRRI